MPWGCKLKLVRCNHASVSLWSKEKESSLWDSHQMDDFTENGSVKCIMLRSSVVSTKKMLDLSLSILKYSKETWHFSFSIFNHKFRKEQNAIKCYFSPFFLLLRSKKSSAKILMKVIVWINGSTSQENSKFSYENGWIFMKSFI